MAKVFSNIEEIGNGMGVEYEYEGFWVYPDIDDYRADLVFIPSTALVNFIKHAKNVSPVISSFLEDD